jgi:hypothetical protein
MVSPAQIVASSTGWSRGVTLNSLTRERRVVIPNCRRQGQHANEQIAEAKAPRSRTSRIEIIEWIGHKCLKRCATDAHAAAMLADYFQGT